MQIRSGRPFLGIDGALLRSFLLSHPDDFTPDEFRLGAAPDEAAGRVLPELEAEGVVRSLDGGHSYVWGPVGEEIARTHPGGRYRRSDLTREMWGLAGRLARTSERASRNLFYPSKVVVYGSYLDGGKTVGDLDLAVELRCLVDEGPEVRRERAVRRAAELGRFFLPDEWPEAEAFLRSLVLATLRGDRPWVDIEPYERVVRWEPNRTLTLVDVDGTDEKAASARGMVDQARADHRLRYGSA